MPLTGIALSAAGLQFGGDGDWDQNVGSPPQTIVGTLIGTGNVEWHDQHHADQQRGWHLQFPAELQSEPLAEQRCFTANLPAGAQTFLNAIPLGGNVDITASSGPFGAFSSTLNDLPVTCFASGTMIATARGEVAVENLQVGDLVLTAHGGAALQPIIWIGHSQVNVARHRNRAKVAPILIKAGALAEGVPHRDLRVSPEHAMFLDGHLVPAKHLVNGATIVQEVWCPEVTYWHVELPAHGLLVAEGAVSESYFDDGNRKYFDNYGVSTLFKDFDSERHNGKYAEAACYPLLQEGALLERIRLRLNGRVMAMEAAERRSA